MGLQLLSLARSPVLGMKVIRPLLMEAEVAPELSALIPSDALPSPGLNPLKGPTMLSCGKLGLGRRSQLPTLERGRGAC